MRTEVEITFGLYHSTIMPMAKRNFSWHSYYRSTILKSGTQNDIKQECIPVGCVLPAAVAVCWGGVCHSACWDTPPRPGPGQPLRGLGLEPSGVGLDSLPPGVGLETLWVWACRDPLGVGLETPPARPPNLPLVWAWRPPGQLPNPPSRVWAWRPPPPPWKEFFVLCYHHRGEMQTHADALPTHESDVAFRKWFSIGCKCREKLAQIWNILVPKSLFT